MRTAQTDLGRAYDYKLNKLWQAYSRHPCEKHLMEKVVVIPVRNTWWKRSFCWIWAKNLFRWGTGV